MLIVKVVRNPKSADRFTVLFGDGDEIKVGAAQIADFELYSGRELTDEDYSELREGLSISSAKARAIRILGSRNLSAREMERRLTAKGELKETAQRTVEWLEDIGAVNDAGYAVMIAGYYSEKGYGAARIRDELYRRGIPRELWDDALDGLVGSDDAINAFLDKKLRGGYDKADLRHAVESLCRRGFSFDEARSAVNKYVENSEETGDAEQ